MLPLIVATSCPRRSGMLLPPRTACHLPASLKGSPGSFAYAATKWALRGMTKSAAIDLSGRKIRVNSVHPGPIDTDMIAFRTPEQREERMKQVPMHRHGTPEEVAQLVGIPALRRGQLHHRGGDRHRRRFIGLAPAMGCHAQIPRFVPLTSHSGQPSRRHYR